MAKRTKEEKKRLNNVHYQADIKIENELGKSVDDTNECDQNEFETKQAKDGL